MKKKTKKKRSEVKRPALVKGLNARVRQATIDFDYLDQLNEAELDWLNKFMEEENNASFKNDDTDLNKSDEDKRRVYSNNNSRNRCLYTRTEAKVKETHILNYEDSKNLVEEKVSSNSNPANTENAIIDYLDQSNLRRNPSQNGED